MGREVPVLLNDEQMRKFVTEGFLILKTDFSEQFHQKLMEQLNQVYEQEGNPGNNLLPRIRDLQKVFDNPIITGALTSVLGPNYLMHTHRHGHFNASPKAGGWHKDSYWGYKKMRNHHPWWAMIMYFPQDTPVELGPTGVMPGTQNYESRTFESDETEGEAVASGNAGTFALIHYDIWHRSTPNVLGQPRYMLKFEFMRTEAPTAPSWDCLDREWKQPAAFSTKINEHEMMWKETWNWLSGQIGSLADSEKVDTAKVQEAAAQLEDSFEPTALNAAYNLAAMGDAGIQALLQGLRHESLKVSRTSAYGLAAAGSGAVAGLEASLGAERVETVVHAVFALGELRHLAASAIPQLLELLEPSTDVVIRQTVAEALALIGAPVDQVVEGLIRCLKDEDVQVRFIAGLSLCRMGAAADEAVPALEIALEDDNRYVRGHAAEALHYIGTDSAKKVLIEFLLNSRWCPSTTPQSTFYP
ncbi:HEAT repeat domain-containing protein [Paenibacillus radicis (ex Xue et al. 2023)]|uniref:HEAT repeat domain-containing protein n=1 Tax=Paenibacillus radicis (ex Xue et al. 2023) TaxID=2972489 RepID=A0ABT1YBB8_9BACL|nr:HEAT repeat domain-containing protein [Paenibacillus radicis (ex Xue et al. 2023)]MCR8630488.1 HEAT repeat domain-containing protein [Paenibacillus radicis (ex Xue et al. 2023)]